MKKLRGLHPDYKQNVEENVDTFDKERQENINEYLDMFIRDVNMV